MEPDHEAIAVPKPLLQILFDTAVNSMDFGSGFLGDEEVTALRQTADLLGVDPLLGTPAEYRKRLAHTFSAAAWPTDGSICEHCRQPFEVEVHAEAPNGA